MGKDEETEFKKPELLDDILFVFSFDFKII